MSTTALMNTYGDRETTLVKGEGARLWDDRGNVYLDVLSGIAVCGLGHAHPAVTAVLAQQAATLVHVSNHFNIPAQQNLAEKLRQVSGMDKVFFSNSGAEANEAAIKIARKYGNDQGVEKPAIIVMQNSFHGRTLATLSASGNPKMQQGFTPLVEGFIRVPFNDTNAIVKAGRNNPNIVAILVEPIQGEGGVKVPADNYLSQLREICNRENWLLMLDEIQTGNGRTGKYFAFQHCPILPDVLTTAKGLGNGFPIAACLATKKAASVLQPGNHGSTFGGNPLACRVGEVVIETILTENLLDHTAKLGRYFLDQLRHRLTDCESVVDIRGQGLMIGVQLREPCTELVAQAKQAGLIINVTAGNTIRLLPPLIISNAQVDTIVDKLHTLISTRCK